MKRALFLDFSIPLEKDSILLSRYSVFIKSLFKSISKTSRIKLYITFPLEFYDLTSKEVFSVLRSEISKLIQDDRLVIVLKPNYALKYKFLNPETLPLDILMSEHLMAYLFGERKSFEGDNALVINNYSYFYMNKHDNNINISGSLSLLGFTHVFSDIDVSCKNRNTKIIPVSDKLNILFQEIITNDVLNSYVVGSSNVEFEVWGVDVLQTFLTDEKLSVINFENLLYLLDRNQDLDWFFVEDLDPVIKYAEIDSNKASGEVFIDDGEGDLAKIQKLQKSLSKLFVIKDSSKLEDALWATPFFIKSSFSDIDDVNRFNHLLLVLLSSSIREDNLYSNSEFVKSIFLNIDELQDLSCKLGQSEVVLLLKEFKDEINKIVFR